MFEVMDWVERKGTEQAGAFQSIYQQLRGCSACFTAYQHWPHSKDRERTWPDACHIPALASMNSPKALQSLSTALPPTFYHGEAPRRLLRALVVSQ
jgi:hypothetical protein